MKQSNDLLSSFSLHEKVSFVVGGMGLIGKEVAKILSQAGSRVIILDIDNKNGPKFCSELSEEVEVTYEYFDCSKLDDLEKNINSLIREHGCPDIFVNCSWPRTADYSKNDFKNITLSSLRENVDMHMNSYAWIAISIAEAMTKSNKKGSIVQFGSTYGLVGQDLSVYAGTDMKENASYALVKGGIINFTRLMGSYYGQYGIRVNSLCPGGVKGHVAGSSDTQNEVFINNYSKKVPLKRLADSSEMAAPTLFLASEASSYITGTTLVVDGGWTAI